MRQSAKTLKERNALIKNLLIKVFKYKSNDIKKIIYNKYEQDLKQYGIIIAIKNWIKECISDEKTYKKIIKHAEKTGFLNSHNLTDKEKETYIDIFFLVISRVVYKKLFK